MTQWDLPDQNYRDAAIKGAFRPMLLIAGAGAGKTRTMVERLVQSVRDGAPIQDQVAITFTVKAAHELLERLRATLIVDNTPCAKQALEQLSNMRVGTIDKVVQRLLEENAIAAGLAAGFRILSPTELGDLFEVWFGEHIELWRNDADLIGTWQALHRLEVKGSSIEALLKRIAGHVVRKGRNMEVYDGLSDIGRLLSDLQSEISRLKEESKRAPEKLIEKALENLRVIESNLAVCTSDPFSDLEVTASLRTTGGPSGKALREEIKEVDVQVTRFASACRYTHVVPLLKAVTFDANRFGADLTKRGLLDFDRALALAIRVLETLPEALNATRAQICSVMVDEFQDTSPNQVRLVKLLCGESLPWFVVGDPKQSIYRFRGADLEAFLRFQTEAESAGASVGVLTSNFRSHASILTVVNEVLASEFSEGSDIGYTPLVPMSPGQERIHSRAWIVGGQEPNADVIALREAELAVKTILSSREETWQTRTVDETRPIELSDIAILYRSRSKLEILTSKLTEVKIPYRIEGESDVLDTDEVRAVVNILRTVTRDPQADDAAVIEIARYAALRSLAIAAGLNELADSNILAGYDEHLTGLKSEVQGLSPYQAVAHVIRKFGLASLACHVQRPRLVANRHRALIDKALAAEAEGIYSLRKFVDLLDSEKKGLIESPVPEGDEQAVRLMTVHAAKGLEFPMVIVVGFSSDPKERSTLLDCEEDRFAIRIGTKGQAEPAIFEAQSKRERRADEEEAKRLLYVAMTRAEDHLIVSSYHGRQSSALIKRVAEKRNLDVEAAIEGITITEWANPSAIPIDYRDTSALIAKWRVEPQVDARTTPTKLAHADDENDLDSRDAAEVEENESFLKPAAKQSTAFGRAVHLALQTLDLQGSDVAKVAESAAGLYGADKERLAEFIARALQSNPVKEAAASPEIWREVYAAVIRESNNGELLEGIVDLVYKRSDGTIGIVDYKTDRIYNVEDAQERMARSYQRQGEAYHELLTKATGYQVSRISFVFLATDPPIVCEVPMAGPTGA